MRIIKWNNEEVNLECCSLLSNNWDKTHAGDDTEYLIINANVLGNAAGKKSVEGDDMSSAWAAVHGRKYNNARIAIPFTREFVGSHMSEIENLTVSIAEKCTSACAVLQKMMTPEELAAGRETAMRSQAIRDAREYLMNSSTAFDMDMFSEANRGVRSEVASKVSFEHGVAVSARRIRDTDGLNDKKQFKRKSVTINNAPTIGYVVTMDEAGLKKVPVMNKEMRDKAENMVLNFAKIINEEISKIAEEPTDEKCLAAVKSINNKMEKYPAISVNIPDYTTEELMKIQQWRDEIINNYMND